jgi:DNA-binding protein H-NS
MNNQSTYNQLMKQIAELQMQAEGIKNSELTKVIADIKEKIATYGLTAADLGFGGKKTPGARNQTTKLIAGKSYKNPANGEVFKYSGRGRRPAWLAALGQGEIDQCLVARSATKARSAKA